MKFLKIVIEFVYLVPVLPFVAIGFIARTIYGALFTGCQIASDFCKWLDE